MSQRNDRHGNLIAIGALIVSMLSFGYTIINSRIQSRKIETAEFTTQGLQNRPILSIIEKPEVRRVQYEIEAIIAEGKVVDSRATKLVLNTKIGIKNIGNSAASLIAYAFTDRLSGAPEIRDSILNRFKDFKGKLITKLIDTYYQTIDILPGKEYTIEMSKHIENINDGIFNIHYYFVYKNDVGNVYDTYYWARFRSKTFTLNPNANSDKIQKALMDSIVFVDDHSSYKMFNREESLYFLNIRKSFLESQKQQHNQSLNADLLKLTD